MPQARQVPGPRLVEQEHVGVLEDGPRDGDALLLEHFWSATSATRSKACAAERCHKSRTWPPLIWMPCSTAHA